MMSYHGSQCLQSLYGEQQTGKHACLDSYELEGQHQLGGISNSPQIELQSNSQFTALGTTHVST